MKNEYDVAIIGSGLSGLAIAHFYSRMNASAKIILLEKSNRAGGAVKSYSRDGYLAESGPHGFLDNIQEIQDLLKSTGLDKEVIKAPLGSYKRFVCSKGIITPLPQSPRQLLTTPLLTLKGKLRLIADLWIKPEKSEQSVSQWARHRFGRETLPLVDAAVTGTFAGDPAKLSFDAIMPGVRKLELEHGSLFKGLKEKKRNSKKNSNLPSMCTFPGGMERFINVLKQDLNIKYDTEITDIRQSPKGWEIKKDQESQEKITCSRLVIAVPVNSSLELLSKLTKKQICQIPIAPISNIVMGFDDNNHIPDGFGYLAPEAEKRFCLGALFGSRMFEDRAPKGKVLVEALVGGRRHPERAGLPDQELTEKTCADLGQLLGLTQKPCFTKILRSPGIPQMEIGHPSLLKWRDDLEKENIGLSVCGFGWDGVGITDMVKTAKKIATEISNGSKRQQSERLKPVYF
jgi:protoporphyrinogen/coproporphyrinogen III oxidase